MVESKSLRLNLKSKFPSLSSCERAFLPPTPENPEDGVKNKDVGHREGRESDQC